MGLFCTHLHTTAHGTAFALQVSMKQIQPGDRVRFSAPLSNGGQATWTAIVVRIEDGVAFVRHPKLARNLPFSPVPLKGLYKYAVEKLTKAKPQGKK